MRYAMLIMWMLNAYAWLQLAVGLKVECRQDYFALYKYRTQGLGLDRDYNG